MYLVFISSIHVTHAFSKRADNGKMYHVFSVYVAVAVHEVTTKIRPSDH